MTEDHARNDMATESAPSPDNDNRPEERFPELAELQRDIERCLKSNRKFLDHFLDEDFDDELSDEDDPEPSIDDMDPEL